MTIQLTIYIGYSGAGGVIPVENVYVLVLVSRRCWCWYHAGVVGATSVENVYVLVLVSRRCLC